MSSRETSGEQYTPPKLECREFIGHPHTEQETHYLNIRGREAADKFYFDGHKYSSPDKKFYYGMAWTSDKSVEEALQVFAEIVAKEGPAILLLPKEDQEDFAVEWEIENYSGEENISEALLELDIDADSLPWISIDIASVSTAYRWYRGGVQPNPGGAVLNIASRRSLQGGWLTKILDATADDESRLAVADNLEAIDMIRDIFATLPYGEPFMPAGFTREWQ